MRSLSCLALRRLSGLIVVLSSSFAVAQVDKGAHADEVGVRIRFGLEDKSPTKWAGSVQVSPGRVTHLSGWRFTAGDVVNGEGASGDGANGDASWTASTHPVAQVGRGNNPKKAAANAAKRDGAQPMNDNGVLVSFADVTGDSRVTVKTAQGDFDFAFSEIPYGHVLEKLDGAVEVERTGTARQLTTGRTDDDYPAAAVAPDGTIYVAYISYMPGRNRDDYNRLEAKGKIGNFVGRNWAKSPRILLFLSNAQAATKCGCAAIATANGASRSA